MYTDVPIAPKIAPLGATREPHIWYVYIYIYMYMYMYVCIYMYRVPLLRTIFQPVHTRAPLQSLNYVFLHLCNYFSVFLHGFYEFSAFSALSAGACRREAASLEVAVAVGWIPRRSRGANNAENSENA